MASRFLRLSTTLKLSASPATNRVSHNTPLLFRCVSHSINSSCSHHHHQHQSSTTQSRSFHSQSIHLSEKNPYKVLGLDKNASKEEVKKKYKEMAKKYHPDISKEPDAKERFSEITNAYEILSDDNKRQMYDTTGSTDPNAGFGGFGGGPGGMNAEDIFRDFFGGGFGGFGGGGAGGENPFADMHDLRSQPRQGGDARQTIRISLREAAFGSKRELGVKKAVNCGTCNGTGEDPKSKPKTCRSCKGHGRIEMRQGFFVMQQTCSNCGGTGKITDDCKSCNGRGYSLQDKKIDVNIPIGVESGSVLRLRGYGEPGFKGGPSGDLFLEIHVLPDPQFKRRGLDLELEHTIPLYQAVLGGETTVTLLDGTVEKVPVPKGTQHGDKTVLKQKGIKQSSTKSGNLSIVFKVNIPRSLTPEQEKLIEEFARLEQK